MQLYMLFNVKKKKKKAQTSEIQLFSKLEVPSSLTSCPLSWNDHFCLVCIIPVIFYAFTYINVLYVYIHAYTYMYAIVKTSIF